MLVGVDEAGCGPAVGSLWAAAVSLNAPISGLNDSKKLSEKKRDALRSTIVSSAQYGLGEVTQAEIDLLGMKEARRLVFERALDSFVERNGNVPGKIIVDGTIFRPWRNVPFECIPQADQTVPEVSAASILAKTERDLQIYALCDQRPELDERYGLRGNKGYLAKAHLEGLKTFGRSDVHRASFHIKAIDGCKRLRDE
jgi:ribonuclease HII